MVQKTCRHCSYIGGGILTSVLWINGKFSDVNNRFNELEKDVVMIKTVLIMQKIMPSELTHVDGKEK